MWLFCGHSYKVNHLACTRWGVVRLLNCSATNSIVLKKQFNFMYFGGITLYIKLYFQKMHIENFDPTESSLHVNRQFKLSLSFI